MAEDKKSFVGYSDWISTFDMLSNEEAGKLIKHLLAYVNDKNPDDLEDRVLKVAFEPIKQQLKRDLKKYQKIREKRVNAGKLGGQQRANNQASQANATGSKQTQANQAVNDNVNVTVNVNDNVIKDISEDISKTINSESEENFSDLEKQVFKIWNIYNGKKMSFKIDFENFVKKTEGVEIDFEKLYKNAIPHNTVYFQTWLNKFFPKSQKQVFKKPTIQEIQEYCQERNNQVDAQRFFDHYESNGWQVGKTKMKDWKAAIRTWERNSFNNQNQNQNGQQQERFVGRQSIDTIRHNATIGYEAAERVRKQMLDNANQLCKENLPEQNH
ncbi:MAG: DUF6291 domain-containing protein [Flavobacteriaceae bacterium]|jgi:DNA-binding transcriptional regulator GbsR (MarR family)|nr:DUF6291 domain-containing protein [Flavobacteriaceae bacterium]